MRIIALAALLCAGSAQAQMMPGMDMSGHQHTPAPAPAPASPASPASPAADETADLPLSDSPRPAPPPPADHAADAVWGPDAMMPSRMMLQHEHGGMRLHQIVFNLAEAQIRKGRDGFRWDGEGWWGGDINRLVVKSEGEGSFGRAVESAEVQALYSRAIGPYFDLQGGVRQDLGAGPRRTYATVGIEGLAPYQFETEVRAFLSSRGDVLARAEAWYDQRITQRLVLQPRAELNFSARTVASQQLGSGLTDAELGLRVRYEVQREFAPYVGVSWDKKAGGTARYARARGESADGPALVLGVRAWF
nr:copper resistance protein B [Sphingomonas glacialis]